MKWQHYLVGLIFWVCMAMLANNIWQTSIGWTILALTYGGLVTIRARHLQKLQNWSTQPESALPADLGVYESLANEFCKHYRAQSTLVDDLTETNQAIMAAAQALPVGAVTMDQNFLITWLNRTAEQQLHLILAKDVGLNLLNLLRSPEFAAYAQKREWSEPMILKLTRSGQHHSIMLTMVKYSRNQYLRITRDLTQIEKLETTRRDFVANVSHELRTPLTVLKGFVETLKDAPPGLLSQEQNNQYLNMMFEQAKRMQAIVSDLLTLSSLETSPSAELIPVDMDNLIKKEQLQIETISSGRHTFTWDITPGLHVYGVESELASAILNLMTNAVRYTPDGGRINIFWGVEADGKARFSVTDTGIGIASEHLPRLSERFYRVDRGRSRAVGGTGLGLAITKHIAMRHETELTIQSKLGQGSTFSLIFSRHRVIPAVQIH
jgi:two-component system phosphate regulon sensor histidine kinase PhoR